MSPCEEYCSLSNLLPVHIVSAGGNILFALATFPHKKHRPAFQHIHIVYSGGTKRSNLQPGNRARVLCFSVVESGTDQQPRWARLLIKKQQEKQAQKNSALPSCTFICHSSLQYNKTDVTIRLIPITGLVKLFRSHHEIPLTKLHCILNLLFHTVSSKEKMVNAQNSTAELHKCVHLAQRPSHYSHTIAKVDARNLLQYWN